MKANPDSFAACFFDKEQTKGVVFACFRLIEGIARKTIDNCFAPKVHRG
jgi:hypothetical protein